MPCKVMVEDNGPGNQVVVVLNQPGIDPLTNQPTIINDVSKVSASIALDDTPSSPTYRMQQLSQLMELTKALPPQGQAAIIDFVVLSTDLPNRQKMADRLRKMLNLPQDGDQQADPQVQALQQQLQHLQQVMTQGKQQYDQEVAQLQQQLQAATQQLHNKNAESQLKQQEIEAKSQSESARAQEAMGKLQVDRTRLVAEQKNQEQAIRAQILQMQSNERIAARNADLSYREAIEVAEINKATTINAAQMAAANQAATEPTE
jgi:hypothetical protein